MDHPPKEPEKEKESFGPMATVIVGFCLVTGLVIWLSIKYGSPPRPIQLTPHATTR